MPAAVARVGLRSAAMPGPVCAITGAGGYVGSRIASGLRARGWGVSELGRDGFTLEGGLAPGSLDGVSALVHCAWDFRPTRWDDVVAVNVEGSRRLISAAAEAGVERIVFVSTLSAFAGCRSLYGRAKLLVEQATLEHGGAVVRAGLVWGEHPGSIFGKLRSLAQRSPFVPIISPKKLYLVHEDDLAAAVAELLDRSDRPSDPVIAAAPEPLGLEEIVRRVGRPGVRTFRVPWQLAWAGLRLLERLGLRPRFRSDSVRSLASLDQEPFASARPVEGIAFRPF